MWRQHKGIIVIGGLIILLGTVLIFFGLFLQNPSRQNASPSPTLLPTTVSNPTTSQQQSNYPSDQYAESQKKLNEAEEQTVQKTQGNIMRFRQSLPYNGTAVNITYDIATNSYQAAIASSQKVSGTDELQNELKKFDITQDDIELKIVYQ